MNVQEYIASGILENYVLGIVSDQERQEVECLSHIYPEIRQELDKLNQSIESLAGLYHAEPPPSLKRNILMAIENEPQEDSGQSDTVQTPVVPITGSKSGVMIWRVAAMLAILVAAALGYMQYKTSDRLSNLSDEFSAYKSDMSSQTDALHDQVAELQTESSEKDNEIRMIKDPSTMKIKMTGTPGHEDMEAIVFCDMETNQVYMASNNFPTPPDNMGYQLWAIIDGQPVNMGMVDLNTTADSLQKMSLAANAAAFAVTLERAGGSPIPTLDQMIAMGNV